MNQAHHPQGEMLEESILIEDRGELVACDRLHYRIMRARGFLIDRGPLKPMLLDHAPAPMFSIVRTETTKSDSISTFVRSQDWDTLLTARGF